MRTKKVIVLPYDHKWKTDFESIAQELVRAINDLTIGVEHVGNTSVEGLFAKPIIDIDVVIKDYSVFDSCGGFHTSLRAVCMGGKLFNWSLARLAHTPTLCVAIKGMNPTAIPYENNIRRRSASRMLIVSWKS